MKRFGTFFLTLILCLAAPMLALASSGHGPELDGSKLSIIWVIPFVCMLLSIALGPLTVPHFWHHHFGKVALFWGLAFLVPCWIVYGSEMAVSQLIHAVCQEYLPFIILLFALFTVAGGVRLKGQLVGTPVVNTGILAVGTILASWMGTTGAAMLLIRPLLRANAHRKFRVHSVIFFIFLVANIGGSLTPLGDPPLFLGFLKGVSFFWTTKHLLIITGLISALLLALYFVVDTILFAKEGKPHLASTSDEKLGLDGKINLLLLAGVVASVLISGVWNPGVDFSKHGIPMTLNGVVRDISLLIIAGLSWVLTSKECRRLNDFTWEPILEVAKLFIGIFISMVPAIAILRAGEHGALASVIALVSHEGQPVNSMFFWCTGLLSSFLDNAPTYLVFFNTAGGDAVHLMGEWADTLTSISAGAVFMGAVTYIGNAPNFMVRSIAAEQGIPMPSFFGYMVWSVGILFPLFGLLTLLFFM